MRTPSSALVFSGVLVAANGWKHLQQHDPHNGLARPDLYFIIALSLTL